MSTTAMHQVVGELLEQNQTTEALAYLNSFEVSNLEITYLKVKTLYEQGEYQEAYALGYEILSSLTGQQKQEVLKYLGMISVQHGELHQAEEFFYEAEGLARERDITEYLKLVQNRAVITAELGQYEEALKLFIQAKTQTADILLRAKYSVNIAATYNHLGKYHPALNEAEKTLSCLQKKYENETMTLMAVYEVIGLAHMKLGELKQSLEAFQAGLTLSEHPMPQKVELWLGLCKLHQLRGEPDLALHHLQSALDYCEETGLSRFLLVCHKAAYDFWQNQDAYQEALHHCEKHFALKDKLRSERVQQQHFYYRIRSGIDQALAEQRLAKEKAEELGKLNLMLEQQKGDLEIKNAQLEHMNNTDPLTKIYNRRYLSQRLFEEYAEALRLGRDLTVIMLDVDFFKKVNDNFSHAVGDDVLTHVAQLLVGNIRAYDLVARYGGEEFTVLCPQLPVEGAKSVAEKLRAAIEAYNWERIAAGLKITISLGIATGTHYSSYEKMLDAADKKLYEAKEGGRNQWCC